MKKLIIIVQMLALSSALVAGPSSGAGGVELGKWWKESGTVKSLKLTDTQVKRIEQFFLNHRPRLNDLYAELNKREYELKMLMKADPVDDAKVLSQTEFVAVSRAALEKANAAMMLDIRKELTAEQWDKLQEIRELRKSGLAVARTSGAQDEAQSGEKFYRVGSDGIVAPKCVYQPLPGYTPEAREAKVQGIMLLQGIIRKNGRIDSLKVLQGLGYGLDQSAIDMLSKEWRFEPGTLHGKPVDVQANIEVSFRLY
jgi:TonB family protein